MQEHLQPQSEGGLELPPVESSICQDRHPVQGETRSALVKHYVHYTMRSHEMISHEMISVADKSTQFSAIPWLCCIYLNLNHQV